MATSAVGRAPGKLILCGEHAVVYGHPAVAFAVDLHTEVTLERQPGPLSIPGEDARLRAALRALLPDGLRVELTGTLPVGRGMGSSASLAVAAVRALDALTGRPAAAADELVERSMPAERVFHGNPSGLDAAVIAHGGVLRYARGSSPVHLPPPRWTGVVLDSGRPGDTRALVGRVAAQRPQVDPILERLGALTEAAVLSLDDPAALGLVLDEAHARLTALGVSTPELNTLVDLARGQRCWGAKLCGAGGGGVVLALCPEPEGLLSAARARGVRTWAVRPTV